MRWLRLRPENPTELDQVDWRGRWIGSDDDYDDEEEEEGSSDYASGSEQSDQGREAIDRFKNDLFADDDEGDKSKDGMCYSRFGY